MKKTLQIPGLPEIEITSRAECEKADWLVCMRKGEEPGGFDDNVEDVCVLCGTAVVHRPYMPKAPKRICMKCAIAEMTRKGPES